MATTDDLIISIRADVTQLQNQLRGVDSQLRGTERQGNETANAIKGLAVQFLGLGAAIEGLRKLVDVNREFGILKAGLETATGSIDGATESFAALQEFASKTPYTLQQSVDGFTKLVNLGLTPSERALKSYGDTSAALGKDLSQMVEAVADAATGEFERLKEFGIKSKNQGDTIAFTFKGTTQVVKNSAADIEEYLIQMGEVNFDGAMKKRMDSLDGALSNLGDSFDAFFFNIGEAGATDVLNKGFRKLGDALASVNDKIKNIPVANFNDGLSALGDVLELVVGYKLTKFIASLALTAQESIKAIATQSGLRAATLATAQADAAAAGMAARRSIIEKELALDELNRARASSAVALAAQRSALANANLATQSAASAVGTASAWAAEQNRLAAINRLSIAEANLTVATQAQNLAVARATATNIANSESIVAQTAANRALATAQAQATATTRIASSVLAGLGGPLGAVITLLGVAATAWYVFGGSAETAAEKAVKATNRIKEGLSSTTDDMRVQTDALMDVNNQIKKIEETANSSQGGKRFAHNKNKLEELKDQRKAIEENINNLKLTKVLNDFEADEQGDRLEKFGIKRDQKTDETDPKEAAKAKKAAEQAAKKLEQLKLAAQKELDLILESNMTEEQLADKNYNESLNKLKQNLDARLITQEQFNAGKFALSEAYNSKVIEGMIAQHDAEKEINDKNAEEEFAQHAARLEQLGILMDGVRQGGLTELELMDEQHAQKMEKLTNLAAQETEFQDVINNLKLEAEQQYQVKRLDLILGTGNKIQTMQRAFEKGNLQGALSFFAADFGGMSQHSRKMFELTKAARLAEAAINIPSTVIAAAKHGSEIGGWPLGLAMGAAALASQLSNLRAIQSASFGGGGSGGGGSSGAASPIAQGQQAQAPLQQRFVNINMTGSDNTMYSKSSVRELIERINSEVKDGAVLRVI